MGCCRKRYYEIQNEKNKACIVLASMLLFGLVICIGLGSNQYITKEWDKRFFIGWTIGFSLPSVGVLIVLLVYVIRECQTQYITERIADNIGI